MPDTNSGSKNKKKLFLFLGLIVSTLLFVVIYIHIDNIKQKQNVNTFSCDITLKDGDLVFRKGRSIESRVVLITDRASSYSHVGVIYMINKTPYVIHTTPDESADDIDYVIMEKLSDFFSSEKASRGSIFRLKEQYSNSAKLAAIKAKSFFDDKIIFDDAFDIKSEDKLYCTELVWKAFNKIGIDLIQGKFNKLFLPFVKGFVILPSSLLNSYYLEEIYIF
ncbi:MAG: hypothetical protein K8R41_05935 [Bacteroidales bacterium]|nr:hypothetical protein [Bacteroidales bacterium]